MDYKSDILFLVKKRIDGYGQTIGLLNSMTFTADALQRRTSFAVNTEICVDGNEVDKWVYKHKARVVVIEAIWLSLSKLKELQAKYPEIVWVIRVHSKIPFLANEGTAIQTLIEYSNLDNVIITFNHQDPADDFKGVIQAPAYLPNIYLEPTYLSDKVLPNNKDRRLNIGCFGAQRIQKNGLIQAFAAIDYADKNDQVLNYYINATRIEQNSESVLKNIRALFAKSKHQLHEVGWLSHQAFLDLIAKMDGCLQVSQSESFNIVTADSIYSKVPVVVSPEIYWMPSESQADPNKMADIVKKLGWVLADPTAFVSASRARLDAYNESAIGVWETFINEFI